jgi:hypothetical protein
LTRSLRSKKQSKKPAAVSSEQWWRQWRWLWCGGWWGRCLGSPAGCGRNREPGVRQHQPGPGPASCFVCVLLWIYGAPLVPSFCNSSALDSGQEGSCAAADRPNANASSGF